jgi:hypothetical protein
MCTPEAPLGLRGPLERIAQNVWSVAAPHAFLGIRFGTRMNVVRLPDGSLMLHSPIAIDERLASEIDALGTVRHVVCPNSWHHVYAAPSLARYPGALLHAPAELAPKRPDLRIDRFLSDEPAPEWGGALAPIRIRGTMLHETVLFHSPSATLLTADLIENFQHAEHWPTRAYLRLGGIYRRPGWHRLLRFFYRDRATARADVDRVLALPYERILIAHGEPIAGDPRPVVRQGLAWLLAG